MVKISNIKKKLGIGALVLGLALSTGCGKSIKEGEIYKKWHEPAETYITWMYMPLGKSFMLIPMYCYDDEDFVIKIRKYNEEKQKYNTKTLYLNKETYDRIKIGDYFCYNGRNAKIEDKLVKREATEKEVKELKVKES